MRPWVLAVLEAVCQQVANSCLQRLSCKAEQNDYDLMDT